MKTILLISPYWKLDQHEPHRWMVSSVKLADLWQRLGYHVDVMSMGPRNDEEPVDISANATIQFRKDFFLSDPWNYGISPGFGGAVLRHINHPKYIPDIIIVNKVLFWTSFSIISLALRGRRVILLVDALVGMTWWPRRKFPKVCAAIYAWTLGWLILRCASRIAFFHPQPSQLLQRLGVAHKSEVIPTGIDPGPYNDAEKIREKEEGINVTYVGRLESVKGVDDFLAAAVPLKKQFPTMNIRVVGWHDSANVLVHQYKELVEFTGLRGDIATILAQTHIFVLPSHSEGLSNALMEAMASGCACIASDVGGNRFLIQNGVSGFLFPPGDREALAAHIRRLIDDTTKRKMLGENARKRIEEQFDWKVIGERYQLLFSRFLNR